MRGIMRPAKIALFFSIFILILILSYSWYLSNYSLQSNLFTSQPALSNFKINERNVQLKVWEKHDADYEHCELSNCIILAVVCCGERAEETYTMIKSAIALTRSNFVIEIFTEANLMPYFNSLHSKWPEHIRKRVKMKLNLANYPPGVSDKTWRSLFRECASIRLFLPYCPENFEDAFAGIKDALRSLLKNVDSLIYVDTDTVFLAPLEELWRHFGKMNSSHMVALTPEHEDPATGWYNRFARHPYYGKLGVNSGVMLMNLTRLRTFGWEVYLGPIEKEFRPKLSWGDQDIINIIFHYHPDKLYLMGCEYNYRPDHCMYMNICKAVNSRGVFALHGSRKVFHNEKQPAFKIVYSTWKKFELSDDLRQDFYYPVSRYFIKNGSRSNCGKLGKLLLKNVEKMIVL